MHSGNIRGTCRGTSLCQIKLILPLVAAGDAQLLKVAYDHWIVRRKPVRIDAKRDKQFLQ